MTRKERVEKLAADYEKMFSERGDVTPMNPLEFHLYHLARYWSRLTGFARMTPDNLSAMIEGDLGACIKVGTGFADQVVKQDSPIFVPWATYLEGATGILDGRSVSLEDIEHTSLAFDRCLSAADYDPWANKTVVPTAEKDAGSNQSGGL